MEVRSVVDGRIYSLAAIKAVTEIVAINPCFAAVPGESVIYSPGSRRPVRGFGGGDRRGCGVCLLRAGPAGRLAACAALSGTANPAQQPALGRRSSASGGRGAIKGLGQPARCRLRHLGGQARRHRSRPPAGRRQGRPRGRLDSGTSRDCLRGVSVGHGR